MIRFYDSTGEQHPLSKKDVTNFYLDYKEDGSIRLCFEISPENRYYSDIVEECELEYGANCYIVKKVKNGKIECDLNFDFLKRTVYKNFSSDSKTLDEILTTYLPDGWTIINSAVSGIRRTIAFDFCTDYDIIMATMPTYNVFLEWEIKKKTVKVYLQSEAENTGEYLTDQLNLRKLSMQGDSLSLVTRLYAYGKDGLSFASINGGKEYIDNTDYANKIVCGTWVDERYTVVEELLAAAKEKLKTLSYPVRAYECDVVDLAKLNPKYEFLHFKLHKTVMLLDREHNIKVQHRIVQYREYPYEPTRNVVTLSSVPSTINTRVNNLASSIQENKNIVNTFQKASYELSELISNSLGVYSTAVEDSTGATKYYLHDQPLLENSSTIYTHNAGGYAFTNSGWNNGNPNWQYGITKAGNAIFNKVCAYGMELADPYGNFSAKITPDSFKIYQDGSLKLDASYGGLDIYDGAFTIYKGAGMFSERILYCDTEGNLAINGYLTQPGSVHRALIGTNEYGYGGFYLYNRYDPYKRTDGTYKPYLEVWCSTEQHTVIEGANELRFVVTTIENESQGNYHRLRITPDGGYMYGAWDFGQDQNWSRAINIWSLGIRRNGTYYGTLWKTDQNAIYLSSENIAGVILGVKGTDGSYYTGIRTYRPSSSNNTVITEIKNFDMGSYSNFYNGSTQVGYMGYDSTNDEMEFKTNSGSIGFIVGGNWRVKASSSGGILYGAWDFGQEQLFSHTINAPAFIARSGSTKVMSLYISTTNNPCFNSDNGKDFYFCVGGTTRLGATTSGAFVDGKFQVNTENNYVSLVTDQYGNGGGHLWGSWYLASDTAITSDQNKKNSIEALDEKYSVLFDNLNPIRYKYNDGTSNRYHTGFIAPDVEKALEVAELSTKEFAGFIRDANGDCYLRYSEFIALAVKEIQSLKKQVAELSATLNIVN